MVAGRVRGLDGLRGIAILLVVWYHTLGTFQVHGLPVGSHYAGAVGVMIFFVLSGFLITTTLLREHAATRRLDLKAFYVRRALRLLPALLVAVAVTTTVMWLTRDPQLNLTYLGELLIVLTYTMDFFSAQSGGYILFGHTWSLAVEEQFYIIWPLLLLGCLRFARIPRTLVIAVGALTGLAIIWRIVASVSFVDWQRTYFAPDTVFFALLLGCLLAVVQQHRALRVPGWVAYVGLAALLAIVAVPVTPGSDSNWPILLWGGLLTALIVLPVVAAAPRAKALAWRPLVLIGELSYGWYLWHAILLQLHPFGLDLRSSPTTAVAAAIFSLGIAWVSFRYVEKPALAYKKRFERTAPLGVGQAQPGWSGSVSPTAGGSGQLDVGIPVER